MEKKLGSGINIPIHVFESLVTILGLKKLQFFVADPDPGSDAFLTHNLG
jgi:hypothetical protein